MRRLAVIGGGMGGVSTAYFCDPGWTTDLFEAQPQVGGNATTITIEDRGHDVAVDIGAQFFHPQTHPLFWTLLRELGAQDDIVDMPGTLSIFDAATRRPLFVSRHPLRRPADALRFWRFTQAALALLDDDTMVALTVGDWIDGLPIDHGFTERVLLPWLASLTTCSVATLRTQSARAFLLPFAGAFPRRMRGRPDTFVSRIGIGGILQSMVARCRDLTVHLDAKVSSLDRVDDVWFVTTADARHGPYERVVVNAPPHASLAFLTGAAPGLRDVLSRHVYYPARMVIHRDPVYMPADRRDWCAHNAAVSGDGCEASVWIGASHKNPATGEPLQLFKSWATHRATEPREVIAEQTFQHSLMSPATLRAAKELEAWQGVEGLHFAGHFTTVTDLQDTALFSGMQVAQALLPGSPRLRALADRSVSYLPL